MSRLHHRTWFRRVAALLVVPVICSTTPVAWAFPARPDDLRPNAPALEPSRQDGVETTTTGAPVESPQDEARADAPNTDREPPAGSPYAVFQLLSDGQERASSDLETTLARSHQTLRRDVAFLISAGAIVRTGEGDQAKLRATDVALAQREAILALLRPLGHRPAGEKRDAAIARITALLQPAPAAASADGAVNLTLAEDIAAARRDDVVVENGDVDAGEPTAQRVIAGIAPVVASQPMHPETGAAQHADRVGPLAGTVHEMLQAVDGIVAVTPEGVRVLDANRLRTVAVTRLANEASLNDNADIRAAAQRILREAGLALGIREASIHPLYMARKDGAWRFTVPAYNVRVNAFQTMRQIIRAAMADGVGAFILELAKSEKRYTAQDLAEYSAMAYAAAIAEGYRGPLFLQGDHYQIAKKDYDANPAKAIAGIEALIREALAAGKRNIDVDPSTLVNEAALDQVLAFERRVTTRYIQERSALDDAFARHVGELGGLKDTADAESDGIWALRRKLVDDLEVALDVPEYMASLDTEEQGYVRQLGLSDPERAEIRDLYRQMHQTTLDVTMHFVRFIRRLEHDMGLNTPISIGVEERHIDSAKHKKYPSTVLGSMTLMGQVIAQSAAEGLVQPSKLALQTGTMHGLGGTVDWGIFERHQRVAKMIGVAVFVQHGTSTLPPTEFASMPRVGTGEDHLATEYQKISLEEIALGAPALRDQMAAYLEALIYPDRPIADPIIAAKVKWAGLSDPAKRQKDYADKFQAKWQAALTQEGKSRDAILVEIFGDSLPGKLKGTLKDLVKESPGPFKQEIASLPDAVQAKIDQRLYEEFRRINADQQVVNTAALVRGLLPHEAQNVVLPPKPASKRYANAPALLQAVLPYVELVVDSAGQSRLKVDDDRAPLLRMVMQELAAYDTLFAADPSRTWILAELQPQLDTHTLPEGRAPPVGLAEALANAGAPFVAGVPDHAPEITHDAAVMTAAAITAEGFRGNIAGLDPKADKDRISRLKKEADGRAKQIVEAVFTDAGARADVHVAEGIGRDAVEESFRGAELVNPKGLGEVRHLLVDVIEGTNATAANNGGKARSAISGAESGGTSAIVTGDGLVSLGNAPDIYADQLFASVPADQQDAIQAIVNEALTAEDEGSLERALSAIATANGLRIGDLELVIMNRPREAKRLASLQAIQARHEGFQITQIKDGTVAHGLLASLGRKSGTGRLKVMWTVGGSAEAYMNLAVASSIPGAVGALRLYSKNVAKAADGGEAHDLSRRYAFDDAEQAELLDLRKEDAESVIEGNRLFTVASVRRDVPMPVEGNFSFITDNGVFNQPGVQEVAPGVLRVHTLRVRDGKASVVVQDVRKTNVDALLARASYVTQFPAAANPAAVDAEHTVSALAGKTAVIHADAFTHGPDGLIALERNRAALKDTTINVYVPDAADQATADTKLAELLAAATRAANGAISDVGALKAVTSAPATPVALAIGPSAWLATVEQATVKVAVDAPVAADQTVSVAAGFYAGVAALAADTRQPPVTTATKLHVHVDDASGFIISAPQPMQVDVQERLRSYQHTVNNV